MNFKISKSKLYESLQIVARAISLNSPIPSLSGIKIEVTNNKLILTGSDAEISIMKTLSNEENEKINLVIIETGSIVIEARYLLEMVRKIDADSIQFEIIDGSLIKIFGNDTEYKVNGIRSAEYPSIDLSKPGLSFNINSKLFQKIITQTTFATRNDPIRPVLSGVNFNIKDNKLECIATDSYRLAKKVVDIDTDINLNVTIPAKSLNELGKSLSEADEVEIALNNKKAQFLIGGTLIQTSLLDSAYPSVNKLIPSQFKTEISVNTRDLIKVIDRAIFIKDEGVSTIKFSITSAGVLVSCKSQEVGSLQDELDIKDFKGNPLDISFSGDYIMDAIKYMDCDEIDIKFSGEMKAFIVVSDEDPSIIQLLLPVRTYN